MLILATIKKSLSIVSIRVDGIGLKSASCRYFIISGSDEVWWVLLLFSLCVFSGAYLVCAVIGIFHNTFILSLGTWTIISPFCFIVTSCDLKSAVHTESHSLLIGTCEIFLRPVMMFLSHNSSGKAGKSSRHGILDCMVWKFVYPTPMGGLVFDDGQCGASTCK